MSGNENDGIRILGFTEHEVELILMSFQCIKGSRRFKAGWEIGMQDFANLTNTSIADAKAQWRDLSSRLMKLPRLSSKSPSSGPLDESEEDIEDCIIVKDEEDDESASGIADESGEEDELEAERKIRTRGKGKQVAKPSVLDSIEFELDSKDNGETTHVAQVKSKEGDIAEPSTIEDRTEQAWADIGDDMTEEKWNEMGDKLAL